MVCLFTNSGESSTRVSQVGSDGVYLLRDLGRWMLMLMLLPMGMYIPHIQSTLTVLTVLHNIYILFIHIDNMCFTYYIDISKQTEMSPE